MYVSSPIVNKTSTVGITSLLATECPRLLDISVMVAHDILAVRVEVRFLYVQQYWELVERLKTEGFDPSMGVKTTFIAGSNPALLTIYIKKI